MGSRTSTESLRGRAAFAELRRAGRRTRDGALTLTTLPGTAGDPVRVGYRIGGRVGPAVTRNRLRRRLREIVRSVPLPPGTYLISAGPAAAHAGYAELDAAVRRLVADL